MWIAKNAVTRLLKFMLPAVLAITAGACATLSETDCQQADWTLIGEHDASTGHTPERLTQHREACAKHAVSPDTAAYQDGYEAGLESFCRLPQGLQHGSRGGYYANTCSSERAAEFLTGYQMGRSIFSERNTIYNIERQERDIRRQLQNSKLSKAERRYLYDRLHELDRYRYYADQRLVILNRRAQAMLDEYRDGF